MKTARRHPLRSGTRAAQRGISLLFTIIALVVILLTAAAVASSVGTGSTIIGNLALRQDTLMASNVASDMAIEWLRGTLEDGEPLDADKPAQGYYAASLDDLDVTGGRTSASAKLAVINWDGKCQGLEPSAYSDCSIVPFTPTADVGGNKVQWLITRLCTGAGAEDSTNPCARPPGGAGGGPADRSEPTGGGRVSDGERSPYFRILVRVQGARNTVTYTETLVHF